MTTAQAIPVRSFAGVFDIPIKGDSETRGCDPSPDAIGGYYGISWFSFFRDADTDEVYKVSCSDGVNGGKGAYTPEDEEWRQSCYHHIVNRCHTAAEEGASEIRVSRHERALMQGFIHSVWLQSAKGKSDGQQSELGLEGGFIGYCWEVPVICDLGLKDNLPPR